jgi:hypothetical protein
MTRMSMKAAEPIARKESLAVLDELADEIEALPVKARAYRLPDIIRAISKAVPK